jgi:hypothetical protein
MNRGFIIFGSLANERLCKGTVAVLIKEYLASET